MCFMNLDVVIYPPPICNRLCMSVLASMNLYWYALSIS